MTPDLSSSSTMRLEFDLHSRNTICMILNEYILSLPIDSGLHISLFFMRCCVTSFTFFGTTIVHFYFFLIPSPQNKTELMSLLFLLLFFWRNFPRNYKIYLFFFKLQLKKKKNSLSEFLKSLDNNKIISSLMNSPRGHPNCASLLPCVFRL